MGSIELGRPPDGDSCSDEDENSVLTRAERDQQADTFHSPNWIPRALSFHPYAPRVPGRMRGMGAVGDTHHYGGGGAHLTVVVARPLVARLTKDIVETYQVCNPNFTYSVAFNPKRYLTNPSAGVSNGGQDNVNSDLILYVNGVLANCEDNRRYIVKDMLGQGTFGQVCKCWTDDSNGYVAVKVIKNQPAYYQQAQVEISICHMLNNHDPSDGHNIVRILDHFVFSGHLCLVFELLNANLYELLKLNHFKGLSLMLVRRFTKQMLEALTVLREASVIHCDLKPENILLQQSLESAEIKLIDFGSACMEHRTVYSYIQSRFYRSPEVLLLHQYTTAIDMWSLGCVAAELFLGLPLFPGACEYDLLQRMIETLGCQPPDHVLHMAKSTSKFFKLVSSAPVSGLMARDGQNSAYHFLNEAEFELREQRKPQLGKRYFIYKKLEDIIVNYPLRRRMTQVEAGEETQARVSFINFLKGVLHFDPMKRWTPEQALQHPFLTEEPYLGPFRPLPDKTHSFVAHGMTMDHNPVTGHWFGAGLSPQVNVPVLGRYSNLGYHSTPYSYASSYSSMGSYGSYDGTGLGSSLGSYGEHTGLYLSYPTTPVTGVNCHNQGGAAGGGLGVSPDTYRRMQVSNIPTPLGVSPSGFRPMSLGASPSHNFQPSPCSNFQGSPSSHFHSPISYAASSSSNYHGSPGAHFLASPSSPSHSSPSRHGPTSPARVGPSALGKIAHYNNHNNMTKRRPWPVPTPNGHNHELIAAHRQRLYQQNANGNDSSMRGPGLPNIPRRQRNSAGVPHLPPAPTSSSNLYAPGSLGALLNSPDNVSEAGEDVSPPPDPRDWDPNYSDELLLGGDSVETSSCVTAMDLSEVSNGVSRLGTGNHSGPGQGVCPALVGFQHGHSTPSSGQSRLNGIIQGHPGMAGNEEGSGASQQNSAQGQQQLPYCRNAPKHGTYSHAPQTSPSRLGPHPAPIFQQTRSQLQSHHLCLQQSPDASPSTGAARGQMMGDSGNNIHGGLLLSAQRDPRAVYVQGSQGSRMTGTSGLGTVMGLPGSGLSDNNGSGLGFQIFPTPFVPSMEQLSHHLTTDPNFPRWDQTGYTHPYTQNLLPHEPFSTGRRPGPSLLTGRPLPPTAPGKTYSSKRSI